MANRHEIVAGNVAGAFFVDNTCTDCEVCRHFAPEIFGYGSAHAYVECQPDGEAETLAAQRAIFACHVGAIGTLDKQDLAKARRSLPFELTPCVYVNGFNAESSFGAHSYFVTCGDVNWLVDAPRFSKHLVERFEDMGGVDFIFLSHRDDVADADKYAVHFGARRIIHEFERGAQPGAEIVLDGDGDHEIAGAKVLFTPGHTRGSLTLLLEDKYLFTGDHFAWDPRAGRFAAFRNVCWYSWERQIASVEKLKRFKTVEWVLPGHGMWGKVSPGAFAQVVETVVADMQRVR